MKSFSLCKTTSVVLLLSQDVSAFPTALNEMVAEATRSQLDARAGAPTGGAPDAEAALLGFNPSTQYVSNTGKYAFVAPGAGDQRGPCPGLNAMANHGYLPHNGIATIPEFISGTYQVFGMGADLSTFLAIYGAVFDGDLTSYSIGGPDPNLVSNLGLLGEPQGLSGSHNKYEGDVSPTRGDLFQYGNDYQVQLSQFKELYALGMADDNYDLTLLTSYRATRFQESVSENPYFFNAPFSGVVASPAAVRIIRSLFSQPLTGLAHLHVSSAMRYPLQILSEEMTFHSFHSKTFQIRQILTPRLFSGPLFTDLWPINLLSIRRGNSAVKF